MARTSRPRCCGSRAEQSRGRRTRETKVRRHQEEKEEQRKEEEKKNAIKYAPILDRDVPTRPPVIASPIATCKLEKGEYVPLWYFTNAGLEDATKSFNLIDEDTLSLVKRVDGSTALVPALTSKESKALIEDQSLSWEDFSIAAPRMIKAMSRAHWPNERVQMMADFWSNLTIHPYRSSGIPLEKSTLLLYQSEQRKLWHQAINVPGHSYNLSRINLELVKETKDWLYWIEGDRKDAERELVSIRLFRYVPNTFTNTLSPLFFTITLQLRSTFPLPSNAGHIALPCALRY